MVQASIKQQTVRPTDPNVLQRQAANPAESVWVGASAGSGKTKVLTDRILRLLLPDNKGQQGTPPHKILALTFTKAGASEMALRINKRLSEWAVMPLEFADNPEKGLVENLKNLLGQKPTKEQITAAQKLFASVVDTPGGLKIMTIHSFCQSTLGRFPVEAGLPPNFTALEESEAQSLIQKAQDSVLKPKNVEKGSPLADAIHHLALTQNEEQFSTLLKNILSERRQLKEILKKNFGINGLYASLCQNFDIPEKKSLDEFIYDACDNSNFDETGLRKSCAALAEGSKKDIERGIVLQQWLDANQKERTHFYKKYKFIFLTKTEGTIAKTLATKKTLQTYPDILDIMGKEAERILALEKTLKSASIAALTRDLFMVGDKILEQYGALKERAGLLDFDDLILRTLDLLQGQTNNLKGLNATPWIRFKLDQGIDHILVDEAQDTNPEQWEIVQALCDDFFDGSDEDSERTLFVVGDEKQSIFSFQRASPEKFEAMNAWFSNKIKNKKRKLQSVDFNISFRSVQSILKLVDTVFEAPEVRKGLSINTIEHESHRRTQAGMVELWPLFEDPDKTDRDPWAPPIDIIESSSGASQMAAHIGETISGWINRKEILESYDRPIEAGDIMILVRSRTAFIDQLVRALKIRNVPVSGIDRMILSEQLVVQDLCAAAQFALLPDDDLTLAELLKSPFIGWNEEQLFKVAHKRKGSLWQSIKNTKDSAIIDWLNTIIQKSGSLTPYDFFMHLLQNACPADSTSGLKAIKKRLGEECLDPLDEFINTALNYESENIPTLQNFLQAQNNNESEIKRQMEEAGKAVRIMTVHAAKGLQAPIVILPDTVRTGNSIKHDKILWPDRSGETLPYFCPQSKQLPENCERALITLRSKQDEEYRRLLYVALTRAENRLYIGGYKGSHDPIDESWYRYVEKAFAKLPDVEKNDDRNILQFSNKATDKPDRAKLKKDETIDGHAPTPDWLFKPMPEEPTPPRPLTPSRPSESDISALSPLKTSRDQRFLRGNVTHKLLQILPDLPPESRKKAAERYVALPSHKLSPKTQESIVSETIAILEHPDFAVIFGKGSMAEVPVTGMLDNKTLISGQIDRLLITKEEIIIIDFKTNRPAPKDEENIPDIYRNQMKAYSDALKEIYPNRKIRAALIWTDGPRLVELQNL